MYEITYLVYFIRKYQMSNKEQKKQQKNRSPGMLKCLRSER